VTTSTAADYGLIIFLRFPEWGKVKTRLAETLGHDRTLTIYKELSDITLQLAARLSISTYLFYEGGLPHDKERHPSFNYLAQVEGDLGEKIIQALNYVFHRHQKVIIIGSDCPEISTTDINQSFELLDKYDVVIGPSTDGGYYLLGCKEIIPAIFKSIDWSTSSVLSKTITKLEKQCKSFYLLRTLTDIDTEEDWIRYNSGS